jgi:RsiW-degrading membrane proteinase PrsW (M82 family)
METHFGHTAALFVALAVAILFTYVPFWVQRLFKNKDAHKYLSREWVIIAFLSAIVSYVILRDGALMDKPIVTTIFWCFCISAGIFQVGRLLEKGMSIKFKKGDAELEIEKDKKQEKQCD